MGPQTYSKCLTIGSARTSTDEKEGDGVQPVCMMVSRNWRAALNLSLDVHTGQRQSALPIVPTKKYREQETYSTAENEELQELKFESKSIQQQIVDCFNFGHLITVSWKMA